MTETLWQADVDALPGSPRSECLSSLLERHEQEMNHIYSTCLAIHERAHCERELTIKVEEISRIKQKEALGARRKRKEEKRSRIKAASARNRAARRVMAQLGPRRDAYRNEVEFVVGAVSGPSDNDEGAPRALSLEDVEKERTVLKAQKEESRRGFEEALRDEIENTGRAVGAHQAGLYGVDDDQVNALWNDDVQKLWRETREIKREKAMVAREVRRLLREEKCRKHGRLALLQKFDPSLSLEEQKRYASLFASHVARASGPELVSQMRVQSCFMLQTCGFRCLEIQDSACALSPEAINVRRAFLLMYMGYKKKVVLAALSEDIRCHLILHMGLNRRLLNAASGDVVKTKALEALSKLSHVFQLHVSAFKQYAMDKWYLQTHLDGVLRHMDDVDLKKSQAMEQAHFQRSFLIFLYFNAFLFLI